MHKKQIIPLIFAVLAVISCGRGNKSDEPQEKELHIPAMLSASPSDALGVVCWDKCADVLDLYDSTSVLHQLDLDGFKNSEAVLSLCYNGALVPVLAIEDKALETDSLSAGNSLISQAESLGLQAAHFDGTEQRPGIIVISTSEAEINAVTRHISEGTSVLDAPGFREAIAERDNTHRFVVFRNSGADRLLPKTFLSGIFARRDLTSFVKTISQWTIMTAEGSDSFAFEPVSDGSSTWYSSMLEAVPFSNSELGEVLPDSTEFALCLPVAGDEFRDAYEKYIDACVKLTKYDRHLDELKASTGKDPRKWEKELNVKETALVRFDGQEVVLLRPAKKVADAEAQENPYRGFVSAMYGNAFSIDDDSYRAAVGGWYVIGSAEAVKEFADAPKDKEIKWPGKGCKFIAYGPDGMLCWSKKGIRLWSSDL